MTEGFLHNVYTTYRELEYSIDQGIEQPLGEGVHTQSILTKSFLTKTICKKYMIIIQATTDQPELGYHVVNANPSATMRQNTVAVVSRMESQLKDDEHIIVFFQSSDECNNFSSTYNCSIYHSGRFLTSNHQEYLSGSRCQLANRSRYSSISSKLLYPHYTNHFPQPFPLV